MEEKSKVQRLNCRLIDKITEIGDFEDVVNVLINEYDPKEVSIKHDTEGSFFMLAHGKKAVFAMCGESKPIRIRSETVDRLNELRVHPDESINTVLSRLVVYKSLKMQKKEKIIYFTDSEGCLPCRRAKPEVDKFLNDPECLKYADLVVCDSAEGDHPEDEFHTGVTPSWVFLDPNGSPYYTVRGGILQKIAMLSICKDGLL